MSDRRQRCSEGTFARKFCEKRKFCQEIARRRQPVSDNRRSLERAKGFEPSTPTLARLCSTPELHPHPRTPRSTRRRAAELCQIRPANATGALREIHPRPAEYSKTEPHCPLDAVGNTGPVLHHAAAPCCSAVRQKATGGPSPAHPARNRSGKRGRRPRCRNDWRLSRNAVRTDAARRRQRRIARDANRVPADCKSAFATPFKAMKVANPRAGHARQTRQARLT